MVLHRHSGLDPKYNLFEQMDSGICVAFCPQAAIGRMEIIPAGYEYRLVDENRCIGCGFCAGACPSGA
jgi:ferredoxin